YYLYQERFGFGASDGVQLGSPQFPPGKIKFDRTFNRELVTYRHDVVVRLPIESGNGPFTLTAKLQGCADRGVCYSPETRTARLVLSATSRVGGSSDADVGRIRPGHGERPGAHRRRAEVRFVADGAADLFRARPAAEPYALRAADAADPVLDHRRAERSTGR